MRRLPSDRSRMSTRRRAIDLQPRKGNSSSLVVLASRGNEQNVSCSEAPTWKRNIFQASPLCYYGEAERRMRRVPRRERGNEIEATRLLAVSFLQSFFLQLAECIDAESLFRGFLALFDQIAACESDLFVLVLGHHVVPIGEASV